MLDCIIVHCSVFIDQCTDRLLICRGYRSLGVCGESALSTSYDGGGGGVTGDARTDDELLG